MAEPAIKIEPTGNIATPEHEKLLNLIDEIRAQGISRYIDLPQIVVCGDQSVRSSQKTRKPTLINDSPERAHV